MSATFNIKIEVRLKPGVLDPQGQAIAGGLLALGFTGVSHVRQGKLIELQVAADNEDAAAAKAREMCDKLLANTVIENFEVSVAGEGT
ncbi:MAG: phosphoribosylformylglycinamidine synthase subunit PurS [Pseudomonadota bacterium]